MDGDGRLGPGECVNLVVNVLAGAIDTTQSQLGHALRLFAAHPEQWARLASDPSLVPGAVQEVLRFEPITPFTARICTGGYRVPRRHVPGRDDRGGVRRTGQP